MEDGWDASAAAAAAAAVDGWAGIGALANADGSNADGFFSNADGLANTGALPGTGATGDGAVRTAPPGVGAAAIDFAGPVANGNAATSADVGASIAGCPATAGVAAGATSADGGAGGVGARDGDDNGDGGDDWTAAAGGLAGSVGGSPRPASTYHANAATPARTPAAANLGQERGGSGGRAWTAAGKAARSLLGAWRASRSRSIWLMRLIASRAGRRFGCP